MATLIVRSQTLRKLEALGITFALVVVPIMILAVLGFFGRIEENTLIYPGQYEVYKIKGGTWTTVYISLDSTQPVTVCITDEAGLKMLKSGKGMLCFFKAERVMHLEKVWRFPKKGSLYLVLVNNSTRTPAKLSIRVSSWLVIPHSFGYIELMTRVPRPSNAVIQDAV